MLREICLIIIICVLLVLMWKINIVNKKIDNLQQLKQINIESLINDKTTLIESLINDPTALIETDRKEKLFTYVINRPIGGRIVIDVFLVVYGDQTFLMTNKGGINLIK